MKYIITICFLFLSIACAAQLESASPNLTVKHGVDADTISFDSTAKFIKWFDGTSTLGDPFNIYDSLVEIQRQVLYKLEIIQKQIETIKRLDSLLNTDHSDGNNKTYEFIESIKADSTLYRKQ